MLFKNLSIFFTILFLKTVPIFALSPVGTHGRLIISDGKIVGSKDNKPVQVAGMSLFWSLWDGERFYNRNVVGWLIDDWNITVIRASMGVGEKGGYDYDNDAQVLQFNRIRTIVDAVIAKGIYVIVDYHAHDANLSIDKAKKFFSDMSTQYGKSPNIIWEIWNEPDLKNGSGPEKEDTWEDIKSYASQIIPVIRENSDNLIVVGTPSWSQRVDIAAMDPIDDPSIAYTLHFYAKQISHQDTLREFAVKAVNLGAALFITEFGMTIADGGSDGEIDSVQTKIWLDWADSNGISWVNWSIVDKGEASAALKKGSASEGGWTEDELTESGKWIRNRLKSRNAYDYSDIIPDDGKSLPGLIEAESFSSKSDELKPEQTSDAGGGQNLAYSTNGAWTEYSVIVRRAGEYTAKLRVAADAGFGGTLTIKFKDDIKAVWNVNSTGGWQSWITTDTCEKFSLPAGETKLKIEWSGTASSLINLNWIEFKYLEKTIGTSKFKTNNKSNLFSNLMINNKSISFDASNELTRATLLTLSGRVLYNTSVNNKRVQIPVVNGCNLLRLQNRNGNCSVVKINAVENRTY